MMLVPSRISLGKRRRVGERLDGVEHDPIVLRPRVHEAGIRLTGVARPQQALLDPHRRTAEPLGFLSYLSNGFRRRVPAELGKIDA